MLRVARGDDNIEVRFDHKVLQPYEIESMTGRDFDEERRCSLVTININNETISVGISVCHPVDNFCRSTGRKLALTDALSGIDKETRTVIWKEYNKVCKPKNRG